MPAHLFSPQSPAISRRPLTLIGLATLSAFALMGAGCSESKAPAEKKAPQLMPVSVLEVQAQKLPLVLDVMAQTEGAKESDVRAQVGGILLKRFYEEGSPVKAGQVLFQIDPAPYINALGEAKARAEQTAREASRLKSLLAEQAVSSKEVDDANSNNAIAQAALKQAELNLSWTKVSAPVSGVSGRSIKSEGNLIAVGDALSSVVQMNPLWVRFGLSDGDIKRLPGGVFRAKDVKNVEMILPDGRIYGQAGKINYQASTVDTTLGTQQLRAEFTNPDGALLPGQFARLRLSIGERDGVFLIPQVAVIQSEQGNLVMVADAENKVSPRPIQTAEWQGKNWVVTGGLQAGDRVILDNLMKLRPGSQVAPQAPKEAAPSAPIEAEKSDKKSAEKAESAPETKG